MRLPEWVFCLGHCKTPIFGRSKKFWTGTSFDIKYSSLAATFSMPHGASAARGSRGKTKSQAEADAKAIEHDAEASKIAPEPVTDPKPTAIKPLSPQRCASTRTWKAAAAPVPQKSCIFTRSHSHVAPAPVTESSVPSATSTPPSMTLTGSDSDLAV
jgi:hypothetical protein